MMWLSLQICARRQFAYEIYSKLFRYLLIFEAIVFINFQLEAACSAATVCGKVQRWPIIASGAHIFQSQPEELRNREGDLRALRDWSAPSISVSKRTLKRTQRTWPAADRLLIIWIIKLSIPLLMMADTDTDPIRSDPKPPTAHPKPTSSISQFVN